MQPRSWLVPACGTLCLTLSLPAAADELHVGPEQTHATVQAAVDAAQPGDEVVVHQGDYSEDLDLATHGSAAARFTLRPASGENPVITGQMTIDGSFWDVVDLTLKARAGGRGIRLRGNDNRILGVDSSGGDRNGIDGEGLRNEVRGCHIHDFDAGNADAHCIVLNPGAEDWIIVDNDIHDCSGDALQLFSQSVERSIRNIRVEGNLMYFTGALGRTENAIDVKNGDGLIIRDNLMYGFPENKVVVFQKGPANIELSCNTMYGGLNGVEFRGEDGGTVENVVFTRNLVRDFSGYALKFDGTSGAEVFNNTFVRTGNDGLRIEGMGLSGGDVHNNLWVDTGTVESGAFDASHNGYFNAATEIGAASDVMGDPLLDAAYQLGDGSPMVDAGLDVGLPFLGSAPDIGWHQAGLEGCEAPQGAGGGGGGGGGGAGGADPSGGAGTGGSSSGGSGPAGAAASDDGGCGCTMPGRERETSPAALLAVVALLLGFGRRRERAPVDDTSRP